MEENSFCPKVFISYSWVVEDRVVELAERLMANGIDVVFDKWSLKPGHDKYAFMEQCVNDATIQKVLIICDKSYSEKANQRTGGVGDETVIITSEVYGRVKQEKFIPIVFEKSEQGETYVPHYIKSRIYIDLSEDNSETDKSFESLLRDIYNKPSYTKPIIGKRPEWLDNETTDFYSLRDAIKQLRGGAIDNIEKVKWLAKRIENETASILLGYRLAENQPIDKSYIELIDKTKALRDILIDYFELVLFSKGSFPEIITSFFEQVYSDTHSDNNTFYGKEYIIEASEFIIWELLICITVLCLNYEKYGDLHKILSHSFFLRNQYSQQGEFYSYSAFNARGDIIEDVCKPKCDTPNLCTLQGRTLTKREKRPLYTNLSLCDADLVLYQLYPLMSSIESWHYWFPISYIYCTQKQNVWMKLKSKQYCEKMFVLFNINSIDDLKSAIKTCDEKTLSGGYPNHHRSIMKIQNSISVQEIGTIN